MKLWMKILIALVLGAIVGVIFGPKTTLIKPVGTLFIHLIKMLIIPLVFSSLVVGVTSLKDPQKMGRIGIKTILFYLCTTAVAITIGLVMGHIFQPGEGMNFVSSTIQEASQQPSFISTLLQTVPQNPVKALTDGNILQIIVFAIFLGIAINLSGKKGDPLAQFFNSLADVMFMLTEMVMKFAPYGVFALIAWVAGEYGWMFYYH